MAKKKPTNRSKPTKTCKATASSGQLVCLLEADHKGDHSTAARGSKPPQHATWTTNAAGKVVVTVLARGKRQSEWTEDPPVQVNEGAVAPHVCANAARDPSTGKPHKGPHAKACERELGHKGLHRIGPHGDLGHVIEWEDSKPGWVAYNQKAQRPMTIEDEPEDPEGDEVALAAMRERDEQVRRAYDEALQALDLDAGELAELREMERAAEERLGELESDDLRTVLDQLRTKLCRRSGRSPETGKRLPNLCGVRDGKKGEPCILEAGHDSHHSTGYRTFPNKTAKTKGATNENNNIQIGRSSDLKHPPERLFGYRRHAAGALWSFADLEGEDFDKLVANLKARDAAAKEAGQGLDRALINDIVLVKVENEHGVAEELILDGWNRARGCEAAGVLPRYSIYSGSTDIDTLLDYVDTVNDKRRHLTPGQRAAIAAESATLRRGNSAERATGTAKTQAELAAKAGVSTKLVGKAKKVKENVTPKLWEAVKRGKVAPDAALTAIGAPAAKQDELAERALAGDKEMRAGKFRSLARQEVKREVVDRINRDLVAPMPIGPFGVVYIDYPWLYENSDGHEGSRGHMPYPGMTMEAILKHAAEVAKRCADDCVIGLWVPNAFVWAVGDVLRALGCQVDDRKLREQRTMITWGKEQVGMGSWAWGETEHLVIASRGKPVHTLNCSGCVQHTGRLTTFVRAPVGEHSEKPAVFADRLAKHCVGPFLEVFAIGPREGWVTWGAEADKPIATPRKKSKILTESDARAQQGAA